MAEERIDDASQRRQPASFQGRVAPFDIEDVPTWFVHFESVLRIHGINGVDRYDYLLASLPRAALQPLATIIKSPPEDDDTRYDWLKGQLEEAHGKTNRERLRQLLNGEKMGDRRPSHFLGYLRTLAPDSVDDEIVKEVWFRELPSSTRKILAVTQTTSLTELANIADTIQREAGSPQAISAVDAKPDLEPNLRDVMRVLNQIVREMQTPLFRRESRPDRIRARSATPKPKPPAQPPSTTGFCFYHESFGKEAKKCRDPCKFPKN